MTAIGKAGYKPGVDVGIAMDVAASEFYSTEQTSYQVDGKQLSSGELVAWYVDLAARYPICLIEDGMAEDDWSGWKQLTEALGRKIQLVGDDLSVTNLIRHQSRHQRRYRQPDPHQSKTQTVPGLVTIDAVHMRADKNRGYMAIISHRSGETEITFIADQPSRYRRVSPRPAWPRRKRIASLGMNSTVTDYPVR